MAPPSKIKQIIHNFRLTVLGRSRWSCLPIRVPISLKITEVHPVYSVLQDILNRTFLNLYALDKALLSWDPSGAIEPISTSDELRLTNDVPEPQTFATSLRLDHIADAEIAHKIRMLYNLRHSLAVFLSQLYMEIDKFGKTMTPNSDKPFGTLLITTNDYFLQLEASICVYSAEEPSFDKLTDYRKIWPDVNTWDEKWSDDNTEEAITVFNENLNGLDLYISMMISKYRKPRKITQHWMRYTFGAIGISLFSVWLIRSGIVDNWVLGVKNIFSQEQALTAARDELLETMRNRQKEELEQLQSTSNSLRSFLLDFSERIKGEKSSSNVSDRKMLEMATASFEEQLRHPIRNFIWGELPCLLHIQILKKTHDIEASMVKLHHQMLMDYETTNAILPSLPTIFISFGVLMISRTWVKQTKAKGRSARAKRRLLLNELEKRIVELQNLSLSNEHGHYVNGLVLYTLDRLYKAVERHAKADGEWQRVRDEITLLGDTGLATSDKLTITSRLKETYQCLLPSTCEELIRRTIVEDYATWNRELPQKKLSSRSQYRDMLSRYVPPSRGARMHVQAGGFSSSGDE